MSTPLVQDVFDAAAEWLGDPGQERYGPADLMKAYQSAWGDMIRCMRKWGLPEIERTLYGVVEAYVNRYDPSTYTSDFGSPINVFARSDVTVNSGFTVTDQSPVIIDLGIPHGRATNDSIQIQNLSDGLNGPWLITVTGANTFVLNKSKAGLVATGFYSSAYMIYGMDRFYELEQDTSLNPPIAGEASARLGAWAYQHRIMFFQPATVASEIVVRYKSSGAAPTTGALGLGFDDCLDFLSHATASYQAGSDDMPSLAASQRELAYGPEMMANGKGGILRDLLLPLLMQKQRVAKRPQAFRPRAGDPARASIL